MLHLRPTSHYHNCQTWLMLARELCCKPRLTEANGPVTIKFESAVCLITRRCSPFCTLFCSTVSNQCQVFMSRRETSRDLFCRSKSKQNSKCQESLHGICRWPQFKIVRWGSLEKGHKPQSHFPCLWHAELHCAKSNRLDELPCQILHLEWRGGILYSWHTGDETLQHNALDCNGWQPLHCAYKWNTVHSTCKASKNKEMEQHATPHDLSRSKTHIFKDMNPLSEC